MTEKKPNHANVCPGWWLISKYNPGKKTKELAVVEVIQSARKIVLFTHGSKAVFMDDLVQDNSIEFLKRLNLAKLAEDTEK